MKQLRFDQARGSLTCGDIEISIAVSGIDHIEKRLSLCTSRTCLGERGRTGGMI